MKDKFYSKVIREMQTTHVNTSRLRTRVCLPLRHNNDKNFLVWINEEDHCRLISMQQGGDMKQTFTRLCKAINEVKGVASL